MYPDPNTSRQEPAAVDLVQLYERLDQDHEVALVLMDLFVEEHQDDATRLEALMQQQQRQEAVLLLHTLKGVAGNLAAETLKRRAGALEASLHAGEPLRPELLFPLRHELQRTLEWIGRHLRRQCAG